MRKHLILSLTLLMVLATAIAVRAADDNMAAKKHHTASGDITAIDNTAQTFTVHHGKDSWTFKTDSSTKFRGMGAKVLSLSNFKTGDNVRVSYMESGDDKMAVRVDVLHGEKSHAPNPS